MTAATLAPLSARRRPRVTPQLLGSLGGIPPHRVVIDPPPGTVTSDFYDSVGGQWRGRGVELVDGTLVEKAVG